MINYWPFLWWSFKFNRHLRLTRLETRTLDLMFSSQKIVLTKEKNNKEKIIHVTGFKMMNPLGCFARKYNMVIFFSLVYIYNLHITGEMTTCHTLWNTFVLSSYISGGVQCRFKFSYVHFAVRFNIVYVFEWIDYGSTVGKNFQAYVE